MPDESPTDPSRRRVLRAALAVGGTSALTACLEREASREDDSATTTTAPEFPAGPDDLSTLPDSQHYWQTYLRRDVLGNTVLPQHHLILLVDYTGSGTPTDAEREQVESALQTLERAFQRGTGGGASAVITRGLLFTVGYSRSYFDRFDADLPDSVGLQRPETVMEKLGETSPTPDHYDAALHLASGYASVILGAEEALFGKIGTLNGVSVDATFEGVFEKAERRPGFIGRSQPATRYDEESIPEKTPLSMGFKAGFSDNLPPEDRMNIREGPFAGGTTQKVSEVDIDLDQWYEDTDAEDRVGLLFSPQHTTEMTGEKGENLAGHSGKTRETVKRIPEDADGGRLGHGQKLARARDSDFEPVVLRRDFDRAGSPGLNFDSWQTRIQDFVETRKAMNAEEFDGVPIEQHGILNYIDVLSRATFLIPPRRLRALPSPRPGRS